MFCFNPWQVYLVTHTLTTTKDLQQERRTASTWTGWRFTSLDTAWAWNIPTCGNPSCILGTKVISLISSLPMMTSKEYRRFMVVSCFCCCFYVVTPSFLTNYTTYLEIVAHVPSVSLQVTGKRDITSGPSYKSSRFDINTWSGIRWRRTQSSIKKCQNFVPTQTSR